MSSMLRFAGPMILGNLLQQCYNIADTLIVGKYLGANALAAVGSSFTLMTFLTSILLGLCMGSGAFFSICYGRRDEKGLQEGGVDIIYTDRRYNDSSECTDFCMSGSDTGSASGPGECVGSYERVSFRYILGDSCNLSV